MNFFNKVLLLFAFFVLVIQKTFTFPPLRNWISKQNSMTINDFINAAQENGVSAQMPVFVTAAVAPSYDLATIIGSLRISAIPNCSTGVLVSFPISLPVIPGTSISGTFFYLAGFGGFNQNLAFELQQFFDNQSQQQIEASLYAVPLG